MNRPTPGKQLESFIGKAVHRVEDYDLVRGRGRFVGDIRPENCLYMAFARSVHACATIDGIDSEAARDHPGVAGVYIAADVAGLGAAAVNPIFQDMTLRSFPLLAGDRVEAVGQPIAAVVAESPDLAADVAEAITVSYGAPGRQLDGEAFSNRWRAGDPEAAFAQADRIVEVRLDCARVAAMPLEPRAALAQWDEAAQSLTVHLATQTPHQARSDLSAILRMPESAIRVVAPDVGGSFGVKASIYPEDALVAFAARALRRPVQWCATRSEDLLAATHARGARLEGALALSREGRILGLRAVTTFPLGHWMPFSSGIPARNAARILPGPYRIDTIDVETRGVWCNTAATGIYRGAGRPEAALLMERLMDEAAGAIGADPLRFRIDNLIPADAFPYRTPTGEVFDTGDYAALAHAAADAARLPERRSACAAARVRGAIKGIGICCYVEPCGRGFESAAVGIDREGRIIADTGSTTQGQGRATAAAQIVAEELGTPFEAVSVRSGDTRVLDRGTGALASRSTPIGGSALKLAARGLHLKARAIAAQLLQCAEDEIVMHDGRFASRAPPHQSVGWREIAHHADGSGRAEIPLREECVYTAPGEAWASGCCIAEVSIDPETCSLSIDGIWWSDDAGVIINPILAEGQLIGGLAQGVGEALMERVVYSDDGQLVTGSLMDYAMPRADDVPPVTLVKQHTPTPINPLGAKGVGESGNIAVPAAVLNAALDALAPHGVRHLDMPLTGNQIWKAMKDAQSRRTNA